MKTAMAGPILGEFGWLIFDVAPHVKTWLRSHPAHRRVVVCRQADQYFFPDADAFVVIPDDVLPPKTIGRGWWKGQPRRHVMKAIAWASKQVAADVEMSIPWFGGDWEVEPTYEQLTDSPRGKFHMPEGAVVCHCRRRALGPKKNWPPECWDDLVARVKAWLDVPIYCIGKEGDGYFPEGTRRVPEPVCNTVYALNNAQFSFGGNSGPTHLSQFCGCPTFSWGHGSWLTRRMLEGANPLKTPTHFFKCGWQPTVDQVLEELVAWRS